MATFENINDQIVYAKVISKTEAFDLRDEAKEIAQQGKSVVIFYDDNYLLFLAPGQDPYQVRKDIDDFIKSSEGSVDTNIKSVTTPERDSSGKFVSKKQSSSD